MSYFRGGEGQLQDADKAAMASRSPRGTIEGKRFKSVPSVSRYCVDCCINGHYTKGLLDTGATFNIINSAFAQQCGLLEAMDNTTMDRDAVLGEMLNTPFKEFIKTKTKTRKRIGMQKFKFAVHSHIFRDWFHCYDCTPNVTICFGMSFFVHAQCTFLYRLSKIQIEQTEGFLPMVDLKSPCDIGQAYKHVDLIKDNPTRWFDDDTLTANGFCRQEGGFFQHQETGVFAMDISRDQTKIQVAHPYIDCLVNGHEVTNVLVDSGATHSYISDACAKRVGIFDNLDETQAGRIGGWDETKEFEALGDFYGVEIQMGDVILEAPLTCLRGPNDNAFSFGNDILAAFNAMFMVSEYTLAFQVWENELEDKLEDSEERYICSIVPDMVPKSPDHLYKGLKDNTYPETTPPDRTEERLRQREIRREQRRRIVEEQEREMRRERAEREIIIREAWMAKKRKEKEQKESEL